MLGSARARARRREHVGRADVRAAHFAAGGGHDLAERDQPADFGVRMADGGDAGRQGDVALRRAGEPQRRDIAFAHLAAYRDDWPRPRIAGRSEDQ